MGGFLIHFSQLLTAGLFKQSLTVVNHLQLCGRTFHLNIYFCLQSQEGRKLTLERTFISLNRSSYTEKTNWFPCPRGNNQPLGLPLSMFFSASYFPPNILNCPLEQCSMKCSHYCESALDFLHYAVSLVQKNCAVSHPK